MLATGKRTSFIRPAGGAAAKAAFRGLLMALAGAFAAMPAPAQPEAEARRLWERETAYPSASEPMAADLDMDRQMEIVHAAVTDRVMAIDPADGRVLWEASLGEHTLFMPVAGNFLGRDRIEVVVPSRDGMVFVLDGATGERLGGFQAGYALDLPPAVFPWSGDEPGGFREGLLLYDPAGQRLNGYLLHPTRGLERRVFQFDTLEPLEAVPAIGATALDAPQPHICFITTAGRVSVFSGRDPARALHGVLANQERPVGGVTLADLDADGNSEVVAADRRGFLHALRIVPGGFAAIWQGEGGAPLEQRSILEPPASPPVAIDVDGDDADDILIPRPKGYALLSGRTGLSLWEPEKRYPVEYAHPVDIRGAPALFYGRGGEGADRRAYAVFCEDRGVVVLDLRERQTVRRAPLGRAAVVTPIVGPLLGDGSALAFVRTDLDGTAIMLDLAIQSQPGTAPWLGYRGGPTRVGREGRSYNLFRTAQAEAFGQRLNEHLVKARQFAQEGDYARALAEVESVTEVTPHHAEARELYQRYRLRANMPALIGAAIVLALLLGVIGWVAGRQAWALVRHRQAQALAAAGQTEQAAALLLSLGRAFPRRGKYHAEAADLLIKSNRMDARTAPVFERAHAAFPREPRYLMGLATAWSAEPRLDEPAARAYAAAAEMSRNPGPWHFIHGQALRASGKPQEALEAFRQAVMLQVDDPRLPGFMTDLYIELGVTAPEILPTLDRVLEDRKGDRAFLRTYCQACQEARRYDDQARQMALALLEQDPASPPAHIILATRNLREGLIREALLHAQQVLQVRPNDSAGLRLLGACYAAEHRLDSTAMEIFARALAANPDAPEILVAVSHGFIQQGRRDTKARQIFEKALVHANQDETILTHLAQIASGENDDTLTVRTVEPLLAMGRRDRDLVLQLADAYCRLGIVEDKAEPIYREALLHQPDHATVQENLAAIWLRRGRADQESAQVYEAVHVRHPERFDLGLQLLRCWAAMEMPERALELGRQLEQMEPENNELRKLMALVSDRADQMDTAIAGYERVLETNPDDAEAIAALSSLYGRRRRRDNRAIEIFNRAIQLRPQEPQHYLAAARADAGRGAEDHAVQVVRHLLTRSPEAIQDAIGLLESLAETHPRAFALRYYLVDSQIFTGKLAEARAHLVEMLRLDPALGPRVLEGFERILEKDPRDAMTHLEKGRLLLAREELAAARQALEQALQHHPENEEIVRALMGLYQQILSRRDSTEVRYQLGRLAMRVEKYDLAISCFQQTAKDARWEGESLRSLARCFMAKGMLDLALQELRRLPAEEDVKALMYDLGQRYEAVHDVQGAREVYKLIFAADITFRDVKGKLERLIDTGAAGVSAERTAIINALSDEARQRYELIQELGRGAMGIVYKARDHELEEMVALKILPDNLIRNPEAVRRFKQEARNARRLAHPNIVRIHDIGEERGRKYISMEFIEGTDLKQKLRQSEGRKLPLDQVLRYGRQICEALSYAHSIGIVHRDIKPANLMITGDDQIKVTDFGIAKMVQDETPDSTQAGAIIGTPLYMSPEQVKGGAVDHRADLYSLGCVFHEMVAGRPPFVEGDLGYQHMFVEPKPIRDVSERFSALVMKCLAKDPAARWSSAQEILEELGKISLEPV